MTNSTTTRKRAPNKLGQATTKKHTGYRFTDKDPELEFVVSCIDEYVSKGGTLKEIEKGAEVSASTMRNWRLGKTHRPGNLTMSWVMTALGYTQGGVKENFGWRKK